MFMTLAFILAMIALIIACVFLFLLLKSRDKMINDLMAYSERQDARSNRVIEDLEKAVEMLHEELEKTREQ